jgi:hypothetical protein
MFERPGFGIHPPDPQGTIVAWWAGGVSDLPAAQAKVANSIIMFALRSLWLERNAQIFDDASPS